jgi:hypothetical protein
MSIDTLTPSIASDLQVQASLLDLYSAELSSISLWRCVTECRRALESHGLATPANVQALARETVCALLARDAGGTVRP